MRLSTFSEPLYAVVPMKDPRRAKLRLSETLSDTERYELARLLFRATLETLVDSDLFAEVLVAGPPGEVETLAAESLALFVVEPEPSLNEALATACDTAISRGARTVAVIPSDLVLLDEQTVRDLLAASAYYDLGSDFDTPIDTSEHGPPNERPAKCLVVAPDRHRTGTNALVLPVARSSETPRSEAQPREAPSITFRFGAESAAAHQQAGENAGLAVRLLLHPRLDLDLDTPQDLHELRARLRADQGLSSSALRSIARHPGLRELLDGHSVFLPSV